MLVLQTNSSHVIYKNTIRGQNGSSDTHHGPFHVDFSCAQTRPGVQTVAFSVRGRWRRSSSFDQNSFCSPESVLLLLQHRGPARHIWILELHSDPEGLHRRRALTGGAAEHRAAAGPEDLGGTPHARSGGNRGRHGDGLLLGHRQRDLQIRADP